MDKAAPLFGQCGEQQLDALLERGNIGRWAVHKGTEVADPDKSLSGPIFPREGLPVLVPDLPVEEQGLTHDRVVAEAARMAEAVWLQLLVGTHVLANAQRGLHLSRVKR